MVKTVLTKAGAAMKAWEIICQVVVQTVFLYRSEIWVVIGETLAVLEVFHHCVARKIARKTTRNAGDGGWEWLLVE